MKITKVPDEYDMNCYRKKNYIAPETCPFCGHMTKDARELCYEFMPVNNRPFWKHDCSFKERIHEVGLYDMIFRKYHIIYTSMKCEECGATWRGDLTDDQKPKTEYFDKYRNRKISERTDNYWMVATIIIPLITVLILYLHNLFYY